LPVINVESEKFDESVLKSDKPALVLFCAQWCPFCKRMDLVFQNTADEMENSLTFCKTDIEKQSAIASAYGVKTIPTIILFKNGSQAGKLTGACTQQELTSFLAENK
jgi:thioredoxin